VGAVALIIGGLLTAGALGDVAPITVTGTSASSDSPAATDTSSAPSDTTASLTGTSTTSSSVTYTPTIATDKADYPPGATVTITGAGWPAQDAIIVQTDDAIGKTWSDTGNVTSDDNGDFTYSFQLPNTFISDYATTATDAFGLSATTTFTDAQPLSGKLQAKSNPTCSVPDSHCTPPWQDNAATGWAELQTVPMRLDFAAGQNGSNPNTFTISIDHANNNSAGLESLTNFATSGNVTITGGIPGGITFSTSQGGDIWNYSFTASISDASEGFISFNTRLRAGAHAFTGNSLQVKGAGTIQFTKPAAAPGTPDLTLTKSALADVSPGQTLTYTLQYRNLASGSNSATGVQLTDTLPSNVTYVAGSCTGPCSFDSQSKTIIWTLGTIPAGSALATQTFQATVSSSAANNDAIVNAAQILSAENDANLADNTKTFTSTVRVPSISGAVLNDLNGNTFNDDGGVGIAGAQVKLFKDGPGLVSGSLDANDQQVGSTITTDATSGWTFSGTGVVAINATYFVVRANPAGYSSTNAINETVATDNSIATKVSNDQIKVVLGALPTFSANDNFLAQSTGVDHFLISAPASATAGSPFSVTVTAQDAANNTVTGYTGTIHFVSSDSGTGVVLPTDYTFVAGDNGSHTFTNGVTLVTAGSQSITVNDTVQTLKTGSANVTVNAAALDHIKISPASATILAGGSQAYTAEAFDQYNNSRGDVTGSTSFSIGPNGSCTNGATPSCTATVAGAHTVTGTFSGKSDTASLTVVHGEASKIALSGSTADLASGSNRALTATIQDAYGNTVTTGSGSGLSVTFAYSAGSGAGTVGGLGSSTASGGVATKTVTGGLIGSVTIEASSGSLAKGTGNPISFTVVAATSSVGLTVSQNPVQYSDPTTLTATISPADLGPGGTGTGTVEFYLGTTLLGSTTTISSAGVATLSPQMLFAPATYNNVKAKFISSNLQLTGSESALKSVTVTQEDARTTYSGSLFASTASATSSTATVVLSTTVQDITAVPSDPFTDAYPGVITNAKVSFYVLNGDGTRTTVCSNLPVGLVSSSDSKTGTATCNWTPDIGNSNSVAYTIGTVVTGYYTRDSQLDDTVVTVSKAIGTNFITGGGYLILSNSAGLNAGAPGSRNNFGFNVKYNAGGTNLQGNINTIVRNNGRVYQIKGNSMTSLNVQPPSGCTTGVPASSTCPYQAVFTGKANIQDITNPLLPASIDGNATLKVTMTDKGEPGTSDTIGVTVWNKQGGLYFSSNWTGTLTMEQLLAGMQGRGNLVAH
jgi:uncharacterized repeat protein (TIGR01451 family)